MAIGDHKSYLSAPMGAKAQKASVPKSRMAVADAARQKPINRIKEAAAGIAYKLNPEKQPPMTSGQIQNARKGGAPMVKSKQQVTNEAEAAGRANAMEKKYPKAYLKKKFGNDYGA